MRSFSLTIVLFLALRAGAGEPKPLTTFSTGVEDFAWCLAFSPDGRTLAAGSVESTCLWETGTWQSRAVLPFGGTPLAFSKDGRLLALTSFGEPNAEVVLWDLPRERVLRTLHTSGGRINAVAFSPDGKTLAAGERLGLRLWNAASGAEILKEGVFNTRVESLAFSPDGQTLAIGDIDGGITLWNLAAGRKQAFLRGHADFVNSMAFSSTGSNLVSGGQDCTMRIWDVRSGHERLNIDVHDRQQVYCTALSPDGNTIASAHGFGAVKLWDAAL